MKHLVICALVLAVTLRTTVAAEESATRNFTIEEAHLNLALPGDWIQMPERALDRFRQNSAATGRGIQSRYVAGFAGPRPPANTPLTLLLVQVFPLDCTLQVFLDSIKAAHQAITAARPDLKVEQAAPEVDREINAVVMPSRTQQGVSGRAYTIPTSRGVVELDLYCPTEAAERTFHVIEACLKKLGFSDGTERNQQWLDEFSAAAKAK